MTSALPELSASTLTSQPKPMRVAIVGAGAIGGVIAGWLARLPADQVVLSVLARGETLAALREHGLRLNEAANPQAQQSIALRASDVPEELGPQDLVILAVKGPAVATVAPAVARLLAPGGRVLVAMNGLPWYFFQGLGGACEGWQLKCIDPDGQISLHLPAEQVIGCVVHMSAGTRSPAQVHHVAGNGLILGKPQGDEDPVLLAAANLLSRAGFAVSLSSRIQRDIWFKLWGNLTMNPLSALTRATCDRILDDDLLRSFASGVMREAQMIGQQIGLPIDQSPDERHAVTRKLGAFRTSMLLDVEASRPMEIDAIVGAVHELAQRLNLPTPQLDVLWGLLRVLAASQAANRTAG